MSGYLGDFEPSALLYTKFTTVNASGLPTTLGDAPTFGFYKDAAVTLFTAGVTVTTDFNSMTGLNHLQMTVTTSATGIVAGSSYQLVIATGSVSGVSMKGYVVGEFSILTRSPLRPTTTGRTIDISATGEAGVDWANVGSPTTTLALTGTTIAVTQKVDVDTIKTNPVVNGGTITFPTTATLASTTNITAGTVTTATNVTTVSSGAISEASFATTAGTFNPLGIVDQGTAQSVTGTTLVLRAAAAFADSELVGATVVISSATTGAGQSRVITANVGATDTVTVDTWTTTPTGTIVYKVFASAPGSTASPPAVNVTQVGGVAVALTGLTPIRANTATAGSGTTITLDAGASSVNNFYTNDIMLLTGGTGVGQARFISAYNGGTLVATVATWTTNPDNTTTFAILPFDAIPGATAPTAAQVATAVWQDATAGDFTTASSIGKSLYTSGVVPGAAGGVFIAGSNAATTVNITGNITGNLSGSVGSVTGAVGSVTGAVGSVTGAVGSVTGNVGGNVVGSVASVTGNVGGNVVGSVASVTGAVGSVTATVNADVKKVNAVTVNGVGTAGNPWGP